MRFTSDMKIEINRPSAVKETQSMTDYQGMLHNVLRRLPMHWLTIGLFI